MAGSEIRMAERDVRYSAEHLWLRRDRERVTVGVAEKISRILTWVSAVEVPAPSTRLEAGDELASIDSQKALIAIPAPVALEVVAVNDALVADPMLVRMDARGAGWLLQAQLDGGGWERLLEPAAYEALLRAEQHNIGQAQ
jgi:glycine cleavage system H protein